ncbi:hypothetical protein PHYSODRAFT_295188 [Phytophthora sojae]|uniref:Uncharacterized protein n=1 Tax=Phytophthora sojae (strain P6497) TaxID=1094619 RepID=G4YNH9_PHYSP|nr:hypothetical protein PHYSODRAFT_295188 [Phytophthora sojae]EGZ30378.1 hypothetical protein PHYSODRAFT_295188 [Phytophthora sojae]|eukprot:XP_009517653.1 hypothetical protein PHYSODRAFT_295188 [Phytophthora sojae]
MYSLPPPPTLEMFMSSRPAPISLNRRAPPPRPAWGQPQQLPMPSSDYPSLFQSAQRTPKPLNQQRSLSRPAWGQPWQPPRPAWGQPQQPPMPTSDYPSLHQATQTTPKSLNQQPPPSKPAWGQQRQPPRSTSAPAQASLGPTSKTSDALFGLSIAAAVCTASSSRLKSSAPANATSSDHEYFRSQDGLVVAGQTSHEQLVPGSSGLKNRNRALNGGIVVVQLKLVEVDREMMATGEPQFATSSADTDEAVLQSLWLPSVQADQCFIKPARNEEELKLAKPRLAFINDTVRRKLRRPTASVVF